ncbi:MAG: ATP-binding protein [Bacillota bacterium]|jgi:anti-sigma regulatory factor (Ser/Thr protein kinase)
MKELSLNILDIAKNSTKAQAGKVEITLEENTETGFLTIIIKDDGCGMSREFLEKVSDPFTTTRTTRKVGLGLPLFKLAAEQAGGWLKIESEEGVGTTVTAAFELNNIDRMPVGDLPGTFVTLVQGDPDVRFILTCRVDDDDFVADTDEIKEILEGMPITSPQVLVWLSGFVSDNLSEIGFKN